MKSVQILLTLLFAVKVFTQQPISGIYCSLPIGEADVTCVDFQDEDRFKYEVSGCLGISHIGVGTYELNGTLLKLKFESQKQTLRSKATIISKEPHQAEAVEFTFNVKDQFGMPISVSLRDQENGIDFNISHEENRIVVPKKNFRVVYEIYSLGYETVPLELDHMTDKTIDVILYDAQPILISEKTYRWRLKEITSEGFKIGEDLWSTFIKIEE